MYHTPCSYASFVTTRAHAIIAPLCLFPKSRTEYYKVTKLAPLTTKPNSNPGPTIPRPIPTDCDKTFPFHTAYWCIIA